jgi:hypothetical protein
MYQSELKRNRDSLPVFGALAISLMVGLSACNGGSSAALAPPASTSTPPAVADPWNPPLGDALEGVTFEDGWGDLHELPAPVQTDGGWTDSLMAAPSGLKLYYAYERYDFFDFYISNGAQQTVTGPANGLSGNTFKIFEADRIGMDGWIEFGEFLRSVHRRGVAGGECIGRPYDLYPIQRLYRSCFALLRKPQ